jgi:hypothetical protein
MLSRPPHGHVPEWWRSCKIQAVTSIFKPWVQSSMHSKDFPTAFMAYWWLVMQETSFSGNCGISIWIIS